MFGFDGSVEGVVSILEEIKNNEEKQTLTHKEVRAYARCLISIVPHLKTYYVDSQVITLLAMLSSAGLAHYDRSFLASKILKLLEKGTNEWNSHQEESF